MILLTEIRNPRRREGMRVGLGTRGRMRSSFEKYQFLETGEFAK